MMLFDLVIVIVLSLSSFVGESRGEITQNNKNIMSFVNYTPHKINLVTSLGLEITWESKGSARVKENQNLVRTEIPGIELREVVYGEIEGLPEVKEGQLVIVSFLVKQANSQLPNPRQDLVSPDTGASCIRENGQIKAVTGFLV